MTALRCRYFINLILLISVTIFLVIFYIGKGEFPVRTLAPELESVHRNSLSDFQLKTKSVLTSSFSTGQVSSCNAPNIKQKRILYWNDFYGNRNFGFCCGRSPYLKHNCHCHNCYTSKDKTENVSSFDVIVFHGREILKEDLPRTRSPHQLYVFLTLESAAYTGRPQLEDWDNFFNVTMTYRRDSDVFLPYGRLVPAASEGQKNNKTIKTKKKKKHLAAWLVSNCKTHSGREHLVRELEKYLPADSLHVYGKCGKRRCRGDSLDEKEDCWDMIEENYKFYLSLENSICRDYVTEKMFEALKHDVVPVVLGGADYKDIFPENSFINMLDYKNMSLLAQHLVDLANNEEKYSRYLEWKSKYKVLNSKYDFNQAHCQLCQLVHDYSQTGRKSVVKDLKTWFVTESNCKHWNS